MLYSIRTIEGYPHNQTKGDTKYDAYKNIIPRVYNDAIRET